jgi:RNA polymerase sigma-70 factor (ECF subfamily)
MYKKKQKRNDLPNVAAESEDMQDIVNDDVEAFENLFNTYCQPLINFTYRYVRDVQVAENLMQEVFVRIWTKRKQLDPTANVKAYLYTAAKNEALKYLRHNKVVSSNARDILGLKKEVKTPETTLDENELAAAVQQAVDELPEKGRMIFSMSKYDGLTYAQIAQIQNISKKTVETHIGRALKFLRQRLEVFFVRANKD